MQSSSKFQPLVYKCHPEGQLLKICIPQIIFLLKNSHLTICYLLFHLMFLSEFLKHLQMLQNHSVKIQITSFHIHSNPESSWVLYYEHVGFQLKASINFSLSNQLPGLIQFQKKQHLLGAYCVSCMVTGRNSVSELSLKSYSHFLFLLPYDIIPTVVLSVFLLSSFIYYTCQQGLLSVYLGS